MKRLLATLLCITGLTLAQASDLKVSLDDILLLANRDVSDQTILVFVQSRGIGFTPDAGDIDKMLEAGISEEVIRYLLEESALAATAPTYSYQQLPTYIAPYPAYYYYPYYSKPPIYYGFSGLLHAGWATSITALDIIRCRAIRPPDTPTANIIYHHPRPFIMAAIGLFISPLKIMSLISPATQDILIAVIRRIKVQATTITPKSLVSNIAKKIVASTKAA